MVQYLFYSIGKNEACTNSSQSLYQPRSERPSFLANCEGVPVHFFEIK